MRLVRLILPLLALSLATGQRAVADRVLTTTVCAAITEQPKSLIVKPAETATLHVSALDGRGYQWFKDEEALTTTPAGPDSNYAIKALTVDDAGTYWVVVSDCAVISEKVTLRVLAPAQIGRIAGTGASRTVDWLPVFGADKYHVYRKIDGTWTKLTETTETTFSETEGGYEYAIQTEIAGQLSAIDSTTPKESTSWAYTYNNKSELQTGSTTSGSIAYDYDVNSAMQSRAMTASAGAIIKQQPPDWQIGQGEAFSWELAVNSGTTVSWYHNDTKLSEGATLAIPAASVSDAGTYFAVLENETGTIRTRTARMSVIEYPAQAPVITTQPLSQQVLLAQNAVLAVVATGYPRPTYQWKKDGKNITGATSPEFKIPSAQAADAGRYTVVVTNSLGAKTSDPAVLAIRPLPPVAPTGITTYSRASAPRIDLSGGTLLPSDYTYYATGLPAGLKLDKKTGVITGRITAKAGRYIVTYWTQVGTLKSQVRSIELNVAAFAAGFVGGFDGLLTQNSIPAGRIEIQVTSTATFTGKVPYTDGRTFPLKGNLVVDNMTTAASANVTLGTDLDLVLTINAAGVLSADFTFQGQLLARCVDGSRRLASAPPWKGTYGLALSLEAASGNSPGGIGYASAVIDVKGIMKVVGKAADGSVLTASVPAAPDGTYLWFLQPYKNKGGHIAGRIHMALRSDSTSVYHGVGDQLYWKKPAVGTGYYPDGFGPLAFRAVAIEPWIPPAKGKTVSASLNLPSMGEFVVTITGDTLDNSETKNTYRLPGKLTLDAKNRISTGDKTAIQFTGSVAPASGIFKGTFSINDSNVVRKVSVEGVLFESAPDDFGAGFYMLPSGTGESGAVLFSH